MFFFYIYISILQRKMSERIAADWCVTFREESKIGGMIKGLFD